MQSVSDRPTTSTFRLDSLLHFERRIDQYELRMGQSVCISPGTSPVTADRWSHCENSSTTRERIIFFVFTPRLINFRHIITLKSKQFTFRQMPVAEGADDCLDLRARLFHNQTFFFHLQAINNHYRIIASPTGDDFAWALHGYFRHDPFNGSFVVTRSDWWFSSRLNFNSSLLVSTGSFVQLIPRAEPQFALEILWKNESQFAVQYAGWQALVACRIVLSTVESRPVLLLRIDGRKIVPVEFQVEFANRSTFFFAIRRRTFLSDR